jgi:subtilase family serine protease
MRLAKRILVLVFSLLAHLTVNYGLYAQTLPPASDPLSVHASSRIAVEIDDGALQVLPGNHHPLALPEFDVGAVPADLPMQSMVLVLQPSEAQAVALDALLEAQQNPSSPYFRQWLTPEEFAEHFGPSAEDAQRIVSWLESHGMRIEEAGPSRRTITFSGSAAQVERTFATTLRQYRVDGALHIANATDPSIPAALAPVVKGVLSLHNFPVQAMHSSVATPAPQMSYGNTHYVTPGDLAAIYDVNPLYTQGVNGSGESVAVVGRSNINLSDIHTFRTSFGLPANDPQVIVNGANPGTANAAELVEATLDAEYAGALARQSTVKFVASASTSATDGSFLSAQYIVNQNLAPVMTMSFGLCEAAMGTAGNAYISALWQQAAAEGITVLVSAGDSGAAGCDSASSTKAVDGLAVNALCSTPYDLCIGGTQFNDTANPSLYWSAANATGTNASALGYIPEVEWNESASSGLWAGGGGRSSIYAKPTWQSGKGVPSDGRRDVPDLSLTAAAHDGYIIVMNGTQFAVGGTSAASPALASIFAMVVQSTGTRLGAANTRLYALANQQSSAVAFHDITNGNNSVPGLTGYNAGAGYDLASGLGSVDASALVAHWLDGQVSPAIELTLNNNSLTVPASSSAPIAIAVANSGGLNAVVMLATSGLPKGISATFAPASIAAPGAGSSSLQVAIASTVAAGSYTFNVVATSGSLSSSAMAQVTVVAPTITGLSSTNPSMSIGGPVTFTATISSGASAGNATTDEPITGTVAFKVGSTTIGTATVSGGTATLSNATVSTANGYSVGSDLITATYGGDANFAASSGSTTLTVAMPTYALAASTLSITTTAGGSATAKLTLVSADYNGAVTFATSASLANGTAPSVSASAPSVTLTSNGSGTSTLTITTTTSAANRTPIVPWKSGGMMLLCAVVLGTPCTLRRKRAAEVLLTALAISLAGLLMSCGGSSSSSTTRAASIYSVTVTPTGTGTVTNPAPVTITVTVP